MRQKELSVKAQTFLLLFWKREAENSNISTRVGHYTSLGVTVENKGRRNPRSLLYQDRGTCLHPIHEPLLLSIVIKTSCLLKLSIPMIN